MDKKAKYRILAVDKYCWGYIEKPDGSIVRARFGYLPQESSREEMQSDCTSGKFVESGREFSDWQAAIMNLSKEVTRLL